MNKFEPYIALPGSELSEHASVLEAALWPQDGFGALDADTVPDSAADTEAPPDQFDDHIDLIPAAAEPPPLASALPAIINSIRLRLTLDISPLLETQYTGIPVFTRRLVQALLQDNRLDLSYSFNLTEIPEANVLWALKAGTGIFLRQAYEELAYTDYKPSDTSVPMLYPSVNSSPGATPREASVVHDISTLVMPDNHEETNRSYHLDGLERELAIDEVVFCASEATKSALDLYFPSVKPKTKVLYQYVDWPEHFALLDKSLPHIALGRYAVVIGTIEPRKNLSILLRALTRPDVQKTDIKFVIIGKEGWLVEKFMAELTPEQRQRLIFTGFVSEFIKYRLIAAAEFMVFPSLYEGFGIPALEALSLGKPVLASRTSSFPEVIGDAGVYFDPLSPAEFAAGLMEISNQRRLREMTALAKAQNQRFTPQRMAAPVLDWLKQF